MNQPLASALPDDFFLGLFRVKTEQLALRFLGIAMTVLSLTFCETGACYAQSPSATSNLDVSDRSMILFNNLTHDAVRMNASPVRRVDCTPQRHFKKPLSCSSCKSCQKKLDRMDKVTGSSGPMTSSVTPAPLAEFLGHDTTSRCLGF